MAKNKSNVADARADLFTNYTKLQTELSTNVYDTATVSAWGSDPKGQTCTQLDTLKTQFTNQYSALTTAMQDLSGSTIIGGNMRDENLTFQQRFVSQCNTTPMSAACINLASQEGPIFPLLSSYETANNTLFTNLDDISNNLVTVSDTYNFLGCTNPNLKFSETVTGYVDTGVLRLKLEQLSPYYLSPDTLQYITSAIISADDAKSSLATVTDLVIDLNNVIANIKTFTNTR